MMSESIELPHISTWDKVKCLVWLARYPGVDPDFYMNVVKGFFPRGDE